MANVLYVEMTKGNKMNLDKYVTPPKFDAKERIAGIENAIVNMIDIMAKLNLSTANGNDLLDITYSYKCLKMYLQYLDDLEEFKEIKE